MENEKLDRAKANALSRFADTGPNRINCSQAVLCFGLETMGYDCDLVTVAAYFGGGIAGTGEACGAVTGAAMAAGMRDFHDRDQAAERSQKTKEDLQKMMKDFAVTYGSCRCRDLTGYDLSTPEGFKAFKESPAHERCQEFVGFIIDRVSPLLTP
ncbi:MAG: C-GCAxxG-C-C family protein [Actinobacteria bacterium]|nr:C-GCAxxG-C-C family protein [Actinomycetota bacterium]